MKKSIIGFAVISIMIATACKNKNNKIDTPGELKDAVEAVSKESEKAKDRWEERKAKGDTMAIPYKDLQAYLPEISGYTKDGEPKGSQTNMPGMGSWSQTEQRYTNGDKNIKVEIMDYNAAQGAFMGVTAIYKMGYSAEDDTRKQGSVNLGMNDVAGYETIYKQDPRGELVLIVADRFFVQIESNGSNDPELLHSIAKSMNLGGLASK